MLRSACPALAQSCYEVTEELVGEHTFDSSSLATLVLCAVFDSCSDVDVGVLTVADGQVAHIV